MKYIGIIGRKQNDRITYNKEVIDVIYKYNCIPVCISLKFDNTDEFQNIKPLIDMCDGFILQGGTDFYDIDLSIVKYLYDKNIPTLGICLGMQEMAYLFNGKMGKIESHHSFNKYVHSIIIDEKSKLFKIIGKNKIFVNSRHHDYIIHTDLNISSYSDVIESVEDPHKKFFIGVQWHPESLMDKSSKKLFNYFFYSIN